MTLTRAKFNELTEHLVEATMGPVRQAMSDAGLSGSDITKVLLVGGSSRIPAVQDAVKKITGKDVPQIEVTFDIDANGIVNVSAKDLGTGKEQHITITSSTNMSKDDIEKAVKEAEQYAAEDARIKESVETRNTADQMVYQAEKTLGEMGDKIPEGDKASVQTAIDKLKETLKGEDAAAIKADTEALQQAFFAVSEKLYQQAGGPQAGGPDMGGGQAPGGDQGGQQFYDADYKVVDEDDQNK